MRKHYYPPPRELFSIDETQTRRNLEEWERKVDRWYQKAEELFPNYHSMKVRERLAVRNEIDEAVGYSL